MKRRPPILDNSSKSVISAKMCRHYHYSNHLHNSAGSHQLRPAPAQSPNPDDLAQLHCEGPYLHSIDPKYNCYGSKYRRAAGFTKIALHTEYNENIINGLYSLNNIFIKRKNALSGKNTATNKLQKNDLRSTHNYLTIHISSGPQKHVHHLNATTVSSLIKDRPTTLL